MLNTSRVSLLFIFRISKGSVVTHLRCGGKNYTDLVANLLLSPTVKELLKSANICQSYERILSGTFFVDHGLVLVALPSSVGPSDVYRCVVYILFQKFNLIERYR